MNRLPTSRLTMILSASACVVALTGAASPLTAQTLPRDDDGRATPRPAFALTVGLGNVVGWFGANGELFFLNGSASAAAGIGTVWFSQEVSPRAAYSAAVRRYLGRGSHQLMLELSASLLSVRRTRVDGVGGVGGDWRRYYGPGVSVGYRRTSTGGFHFTAATGAGWAVEARRLDPMLLLGVGYTWRR